MCGIAGSMNGNPAITRGLLVAMESRGDHATGIARIDAERGKVSRERATVPATDFVASKKWHKVANAPGNVLIGHTRFATHGSKTVENTHPFIEGPITGAHNGIIDNHRDFDAHAQVDSQALFSALSMSDDVLATLQEVQGYYALEWYDARDGLLYLAANKGPLFIVSIVEDEADPTSPETLYWCSEAYPLLQAMAQAGIDDYELIEMQDGDLLKYDPIDGVQVGYETLPKVTRGSSKSYYTGGSMGSWSHDDWGGWSDDTFPSSTRAAVKSTTLEFDYDTSNGSTITVPVTNDGDLDWERIEDEAWDKIQALDDFDWRRLYGAIDKYWESEKESESQDILESINNAGNSSNEEDECYYCGTEDMELGMDGLCNVCTAEFPNHIQV